MASLLTTATTTPAPLDLCKKTLDSGRKSYEDCFQLTSPLKIRVTLFYLLAYLDFYFVTTWKYFETIFTFNTKIFTSELFLPLEATVVKKARSFSTWTRCTNRLLNGRAFRKRKPRESEKVYLCANHVLPVFKNESLLTFAINGWYLPLLLHVCAFLNIELHNVYSDLYVLLHNVYS